MTTRLWHRSATFGAYLKARRQALRLNLRDAAKAAGMSHTYLVYIENDARASRPSAGMLDGLASAYGLPIESVLSAAGFVSDVPSPVSIEEDIEAEFAALVLHPALCPTLLNARALEYLSPRLKRQWMQFAERLERHIANGGPSVRQIRKGVHVKPPSKEE